MSAFRMCHSSFIVYIQFYLPMISHWIGISILQVVVFQLHNLQERL
jgi:hypothetical protein